MRQPAVSVLLAIASLLPLACGEFRPDADSLAARSTTPVASLDCAACHRYPLTDTNHSYHLLAAGPLKRVNGAITCLDCHSRSVESRSVVLLDSLFADENGNEFSSLDFPEPDALDIRRKYALARVDTLAQSHPTPAVVRPGGRPAFQEYVTSLAHMNGKVDVAFHPRVSDTARFQGQEPEYNPASQTCSAMACHPGSGAPWRFAAPSKGLSELKGSP